MKNLKLFSLPILILINLSATSFSQNLFVAELSNFTFTPSILTIEVGDTVQWINTQGTHNVLADDGSFTSGAPASAPWDFVLVFNTEGSFPYYCEPHGEPGGIGMSGVINVENPVSVTVRELLLDDFKLNQNYPIHLIRQQSYHTQFPTRVLLN